jgi:hypothetical protein
LETLQLYVDMLGIFVIDDGLLVDLVKLQVFWCIICKSK